MIELTKQYKEKGFFIVSPIYYKNKIYLKCGNVNDNKIYYFEYKNNDILEKINDEKTLKWLNENYNFKIDNEVYWGKNGRTKIFRRTKENII